MCATDCQPWNRRHAPGLDSSPPAPNCVSCTGPPPTVSDHELVAACEPLRRPPYCLACSSPTPIRLLERRRWSRDTVRLDVPSPDYGRPSSRSGNVTRHVAPSLISSFLSLANSFSLRNGLKPRLCPSVSQPVSSLLSLTQISLTFPRWSRACTSRWPAPFPPPVPRGPPRHCPVYPQARLSCQSPEDFDGRLGAPNHPSLHLRHRPVCWLPRRRFPLRRRRRACVMRVCPVVVAGRRSPRSPKRSRRGWPRLEPG